MLMFDSRCVFTVSIVCILLMYVSDDDVVDIPIISDYSTTISNQTSMDEDLSEVVLSNIVISIRSDVISSVVVTNSLDDLHALTCQPLPSCDNLSTHYICSVDSMWILDARIILLFIPLFQTILYFEIQRLISE